MDKEVLDIRRDIMKMCWYMRGGLSYTEGMHASYDERKIINEIIRENLETAKKTGRDFW